MSTRATYQFNRPYSKPATIYIHHDGYPSGAAFYFYNAMMASGNLSAESLIRGNDRAEITESHDAHGDTEYRYTLDGDTLTVEERHTLIEFGSYPKGWHTTYAGDWVEFVTKNIDRSWVPDFQPMKRVKVGENYTERCEVHTAQTIAKKLDQELKLLGMWTLGAYKDNPDACNMRYLRERIENLQTAAVSFQ